MLEIKNKSHFHEKENRQKDKQIFAHTSRNDHKPENQRGKQIDFCFENRSLLNYIIGPLIATKCLENKKSGSKFRSNDLTLSKRNVNKKKYCLTTSKIEIGAKQEIQKKYQYKFKGSNNNLNSNNLTSTVLHKNQSRNFQSRNTIPFKCTSKNSRDTLATNYSKPKEISKLNQTTTFFHSDNKQIIFQESNDYKSNLVDNVTEKETGIPDPEKYNIYLFDHKSFMSKRLECSYRGKRPLTTEAQIAFKNQKNSLGINGKKFSNLYAILSHRHPLPIPRILSSLEKARFHSSTPEVFDEKKRKIRYKNRYNLYK